MNFNTREENWNPTIQRCLQEQWIRITSLLNELPEEEHIEYDHLSSRQQFCVEAINSIEEEWLIDPEQREQLSVLVPED